MANINKTEFDSPWKEIIESFFPQFMEFFVPDAENDIDWNKEIKFLNTEFQQITKNSKIGRRHIDKLIEVTLKDDLKRWVLIHVEVQAGREADFSERMFVYNYRIYDRYRIPVTSIAVLADDSPSWYPEPFKYGMWGSSMGLDYLKVKLLDYKKRWNYLKEEKNPFAIVVMAHLKALETRKDNTLRKQWKTELTKLLHERAYSKEQVLKLYSFIDWLLTLPEELEKVFLEDLKVYEKEKKMRYITSAERLGRKEGRQEGRQEGRKEGSYRTYYNLIHNMKNKNFSDWEICELTNLDIDTVKKIMNNETVDIPLYLLDNE
jgi:predicted transposase YdaD